MDAHQQAEPRDAPPNDVLLQRLVINVHKLKTRIADRQFAKLALAMLFSWPRLAGPIWLTLMADPDGWPCWLTLPGTSLDRRHASSELHDRNDELSHFNRLAITIVGHILRLSLLPATARSRPPGRRATPCRLESVTTARGFVTRLGCRRPGEDERHGWVVMVIAERSGSLSSVRSP